MSFHTVCYFGSSYAIIGNYCPWIFLIDFIGSKRLSLQFLKPREKKLIALFCATWILCKIVSFIFVERSTYNYRSVLSWCKNQDCRSLTLDDSFRVDLAKLRWSSVCYCLQICHQKLCILGYHHSCKAWQGIDWIEVSTDFPFVSAWSSLFNRELLSTMVIMDFIGIFFCCWKPSPSRTWLFRLFFCRV